MNTPSLGAMDALAQASSKISEFGLTMPSSPDTTMSKNRRRIPKRCLACANMSPAQLVSAIVGTPAAFNSASTAPVPGTASVMVAMKLRR